MWIILPQSTGTAIRIFATLSASLVLAGASSLRVVVVLKWSII
jgi:hypothetical protein